MQNKNHSPQIADANLNVMVIGKYYVEGFAVHISDTLEQMGHKVYRFEPGIKINKNANTLVKRWGQAKSTCYDLAKHFSSVQQVITGKLESFIEGKKIDLTIVIHDFLLPSEVDLLRKKTKSPVVLWFPDAISRFERAYFLNAKYDALFFKDPYIAHILANTTAKPAYYLPECCNPLKHGPSILTSEDFHKYACDIVIAGTLNTNRVAVFEHLLNYDVKIWGPSPSRWLNYSVVMSMVQNEYLAYEEKAKAFQAAKIVLNNLYPGEIWGLNCRAFESTGAGGFLLVDWRPCVSQLFKDGDEIVTFRSLSEMKEKIDYYLTHEKERSIIARKGMERTLLEHTYRNRLDCLLNTVFYGKAGFDIQVPAEWT